MLVQVLDDEGFSGSYDFLFLPIKIKANLAFGYAFLNFVNMSEAERFMTHFTGYSKWDTDASPAEIDWSKSHQGFQQQLERYNKSAIMQLNSIPEEFQPIVFKNGLRIPLPPPAQQAPSRTTSQHRHNRRDTGMRSAGSPQWAHTSKVAFPEFGSGGDGEIPFSNSYSMPSSRIRFSNNEELTRKAKMAQRSMRRIASKLSKLKTDSARTV
jgi:hypothetical protein